MLTLQSRPLAFPSFRQGPLAFPFFRQGPLPSPSFDEGRYLSLVSTRAVIYSLVSTGGVSFSLVSTECDYAKWWKNCEMVPTGTVKWVKSETISLEDFWDGDSQVNRVCRNKGRNLCRNKRKGTQKPLFRPQHPLFRLRRFATSKWNCFVSTDFRAMFRHFACRN